MNFRITFLLANIAAVICLGVLYLTDIPLGVDGEWTWIRIDLSADALSETATNLIFVVPAGLLWLWFVQRSASRLGNSRLPMHFLGLIPLSLVWLWAVQSLPPTPHPQIKSWVLYYPQMSGYYHTARYDVTDLREFLAGYEARMEEGDIGHIGTHPPGLFVLHRTISNACRDWPGLTSTLRATTPAGVDEAFFVLEENSRRSGVDFTETDKAALWCGMLLTHVIAVLTVIPLFLILKRAFSTQTAWVASASWVLVPALAVFLPKSDALFPCLGMFFLWLWWKAARDKSIVSGLCAGLVFWIGSVLSLALIPCGLAAGVTSITAALLAQDRHSEIRSHAMTAFAAVVTFLLLCGIFWLAFDLNLFKVWWLNFRNHSRFYDPENFPRSIATWMWVNPIETIFAVGAPVAVFGAMGLLRGMKHAAELKPLFIGTSLAWALIWLSGKNSGEAARLWLVFFPWLCSWSAACVSENPVESDSRPARHAIWFLCLQMCVCVLTAARVAGFHP